MDKKMISPLVPNIKKTQEEYLAMLNQYKSFFDQQEVRIKEIAFMVDEIKCFWLEKLDIVKFELEELAKDNSCFLLTGAIYLDVSGYEHYYFKSLGDYHLLPDPFLRMEYFFRVPEDKINAKETIDYLKDVFPDTIEILTKYKNQFFILPVREIAVKDESEHYDLLEKFFLRFVSSILQKPFPNKEEFYASYKSFEEIEKGMDNYVREH
ncbi:MAG: hypothetical protein Q7T50_07685, partial [Candidatus Magasanikbacteria bacterium]|nr:hypothetical protein [Candidatus Magasanikbacteria bacterium]